jgi:nuclear pore complex protein Nup107
MAKLADKDSDLTFGGYVRDQFTRWGKDARVYIELGQLVNAIHALSLWREHEDVCLRAKEEGKKVPTKRIKESFEKIADAMEPLLNGFLARSDDGEFPSMLLVSANYQSRYQRPSDEESAQITTILSAYLPDLILAYNSTIQASAHFVSHNLATKSMDLAVAIADDANAHLADAFVRTGRMQELVQALAATSQAMIRLGEGAPKAERRRRGWLGESSRIWDLNVRN